MKHYIGYEATGVIRFIAFGPLDPAVDPNNPGGNADAEHIVAEAARDWPSVVGWVEYDCPCPNNAGPACTCPHDRHKDSVVSDPGGTPSLVTVPVASWKLDGAAKAANTRNTPEEVAAGATVACKLVVDLPDDTELTLESIPGVVALAALPTTLTITGGESQAVNLTAPPAGLLGGVRVHTEGVHQIAGMFIQGAFA